MADVLIFDDDPSVGDFMSELLRGKGLTVSHFLSGAGAVQLVQENRPRLVVLDIMMPGMDGLTACRTLKSNPATRGVKIAVLTAKDFADDRESALRFGADLFLNKPFDAGAFEGSIGKLLGLPQALATPVSAPPAPPVVLTVLPGCVTLETAGFLLLFDAGAGLSSWIEKQPRFNSFCWMLLSRYQPSSLSEAAAASALLAAGCRLNVAGPDDAEGSLQRLAPALCAARRDGSRLTPLLYPQREGEFGLGPGARAITRFTQHPGPCLAYRVEVQGRSIVYCPAHEIAPDLASWNRHELEKFRDFFRGAHVLLHGYRRSLADQSPQDSLGRGAWEPVVDLAAASGVAHLVLMPMTPSTSTEGVHLRLEERLAAGGSSMRFDVSRAAERLIL